MACLIKNFRWTCRKGAEIIWFNTKFKGHLTECSIFICIPKSLFCTGQRKSGHFRRETWKRIRKNDPGMEDYLNSTNLQDRIKELSKLMGCSIDQTTELMRRDSPLGIKNREALHKSIELLLSYNYSVEDIIANPAVLHRSYKVLQQRLETLKLVQSPLNERSLSVLKKTNFEFRTYVKNCVAEEELLSKFPSRLHCIASLLNCDIDQAEKLSDQYGLKSASLLLLQSKIEAFRRFGIPSSVIQKNVYMLENISLAVIERRLQVLEDNELLAHPYPGLSYMICKTGEFEKSITKVKLNKNSLEGCRDKEEYLIFRLKCSKEVGEALVNGRQISSISEAKLRKVLDFFLDEMQVSSAFIISNVYLFGYSLDRMKRRWTFISSYPSYNSPPWISRLFSMSNESFQTFVKSVELK